MPYPHSYTECANPNCPQYPHPQTFQTLKAIWIDETYTVCSAGCKREFLASHSETTRRRKEIPGINLPVTQNVLVRLMASLF